MIESLKSLLDQPPPFVFLGGIHGVGKSTMCDGVFVPAGYHYVTASSLIKEYKNYSDREKRVDDIADNQLALLRQLEFEKGNKKHLLLDGHFCLLNSLSAVEPIEIDVFVAINPDILVLIKCDPKEIARRLTKRYGKTWCPKMLKKFQDSEEIHAERVSVRLGIQLIIVSN
jgi:adenylate kinase